MPYNVWCLGCNNHIGMGVRYNAEKSKTGMYYTTPIFKFRMKCHLCDNHFEIQTDPGNFEYVILSGLKRKEQRWDPDENEQVKTEDKKTKKKIESDPMFKLEHGKQDQDKAKKVMPSLGELAESREDWIDDFALNQMTRKKFRTEKKDLAEKKKIGDALLEKSCLPKDMELVEETEEDRKLAALIKYKSVENYDERQAKKRKAIEEASVFPESKVCDTERTPGKKAIKSTFSTSTINNSLFSNSMAGFGKIVKKRPPGLDKSGQVLAGLDSTLPNSTRLNSTGQDPTNPSQILAKTTSASLSQDTFVDSRPVNSELKSETVSESNPISKLEESTLSPSKVKTEGDLEDSLPNPFKSVTSNQGDEAERETGNVSDDSDDDGGFEKTGLGLGLGSVVTVSTKDHIHDSNDVQPKDVGNALSLLSGIYDDSSSGDS